MSKQSFGRLYSRGKENKFWVGRVTALFMMNSEKLFEFIAADTGFYFLTKNFGDQKSGKIGLVIWL